jgi:hypothetical protein
VGDTGTAAPDDLSGICRERLIAPHVDGFESGAQDKTDRVLHERVRVP